MVSLYHLILHGMATGELCFLSLYSVETYTFSVNHRKTHKTLIDSNHWRLFRDMMVHLKDEGVELLLTSLKDVELCYVLILLCCIVLYCWIGLYLKYEEVTSVLSQM